MEQVDPGIMFRLVDAIVVFATEILPIAMIAAFVIGATMRVLIYYTIKQEQWFSKEFYKRVINFLDRHKNNKDMSFYVTAKMLLEKTYYELFEIRAIMARRKHDHVVSIFDRLFLIQTGTARLVKDTLRQIKYLKHDDRNPKILEISKHVYQNNPCFNRVFGKFSVSLFNDVLNIIPGILIIGGIFGTFLGIMKALPELQGMDLNDIDGTKQVMDGFLLKISYAMSTSILGIMLSVTMMFFNTLLSADKMFLSVVGHFETSLSAIWNMCSNNALPEDIPDFDEHRDPIEALAEQAVEKQIHKSGLFLEEETEEAANMIPPPANPAMPNASIGQPLPQQQFQEQQISHPSQNTTNKAG